MTHFETPQGVGDGVPGIKEAFETAYDSAGGASFLGLPSADAYEAGPGFVQHLRGARCGHPSVICAIAGREAVVVTADLWNGIAHVGYGRPDGGVVGVGLPVFTTGGVHRYVGPAVDEVPTSGGSWGSGTMRRVADDRWTWIPDLVFDPNSAGNADIAFDSQSRLDLRLRLAAQLPFTQNELRLSSAGRRRLTTELVKPEMTAFVAALAADRTSLQGGGWQPCTEQFARNDSWGASHEYAINTAKGQAAIRGKLQFLMPNLTLPQLTSLIDVEIDFDGCQAEPCSPNTPVDKRLSVGEIAGFFTTAWRFAFDVLPQALEGAASGADAGDRPRVSLYVINERPANAGGERNFRLTDLVDLSPFGTTHKSHLSRLDIAIIGRGSMRDQDVRQVVRQALVRAAEDSGFDSADLITW